MRQTTIFIFGVLVCGGLANAADTDLIPPQFSKEQRDNIARFLNRQPKPDRFLPKDAVVVDAPPGAELLDIKPEPGQSVKQFTVQIKSHRPIPGREQVTRVDVYYYRPHPEKGKPGITIKQTVDVTNGEQVGQTEILVKQHTPISREELNEAVALARENFPPVKELYVGREPGAVRWEYLQVKVNRKSEQSEPGDRVVRLAFTAQPLDDQPAPTPVRVVVNVTKGTVASGNQ